MKKMGFAFVIFMFGACLFSPGRLSAVYAQDSPKADPDAGRGTSVAMGQPNHSFYTVGYKVFQLDVMGNHGEHRPIPVHVWYPSHQRHGRTAVYTSALYGVPLIPGTYDPLSWTVTAESAKENLRIAPPKGEAPDAEDEQRGDDREGHDGDDDHGFPVIVFSHGGSSLPIDYYIALERIAAQGFIVAAPAHVNDTADDVRIDYVNTAANRTVLSCFDNLPSPCQRPNSAIRDILVDRSRDVAAVLDALPAWFGRRVDMNRVGMLAHSRGTLTELVEAGGSATWGISPEPRIKAIMGLSSAALANIFTADLANIEIPTILVDGSLSGCNPPGCNPAISYVAVTEQAFAAIASKDKQFVLIQNAVHKTFRFGLCAQTQSAGAIAEANPSAILDFKTAKDALTGSTGLLLDFCTYSDFTSPKDIRPINFALTGIQVTPENVPRTGVTSLEVAQQVVDIAVSFFNRVLKDTR